MIEQLLQECLRSGPIDLGELVVREIEPGRFVIRHWKDDESPQKLATETGSIAALEIVRYDEQGNYRALKGAPNLRTGWELRLESVTEVRQAIDYFYPGAFSTWLTFNRGEITPVDLRQTLTRQTGMYRVTQRLSGFQAEELAARFCQSHSGCLRTILWTIDGKAPEKYLPRSKFDPQADQLAAERKEQTEDGRAGARPYRVPFLCVEACNLFVAEARKIVKVHSK
ncbi:MAG TPA: DR2241 family protein [Chthoniobacterales bacterium]|nr:DR2241 family protein [Chthoniobacterales bacterium]